MHTSFHVHDVVYVLKRDRPKIEAGTAVYCISALGLQKLAKCHAGGKFLDPLRREGNDKLSIEADYDTYIVVPDGSRDCYSSTNIASASSSTAERIIDGNDDEEKVGSQDVILFTSNIALWIFMTGVFILYFLCGRSHLNNDTSRLFIRFQERFSEDDITHIT